MHLLFTQTYLMISLIGGLNHSTHVSFREVRSMLYWSNRMCNQTSKERIRISSRYWFGDWGLECPRLVLRDHTILVPSRYTASILIGVECSGLRTSNDRGTVRRVHLRVV